MRQQPFRQGEHRVLSDISTSQEFADGDSFATFAA